ncbi:MAG: molecular chaperone TorD family protein [Rhodocyclales bacterium]|nr:molecular chaperone TorD family protein [Rhodocyclales bacterium]
MDSQPRTCAGDAGGSAFGRFPGQSRSAAFECARPRGLAGDGGCARPPAAGPDENAFDRLAADYAAIYLTAAYGASPCESAWIDEDHLVCQDAMFQLREIYLSAGLAAADWRRRSDDHLVLQLAYLSHAARSAETVAEWRSIARFMDEHLLRWLPDFAARVSCRCESAFYAGLAVLTHAWCDEFRDLLAAQLGEPRPGREEVELRMKPSRATESAPIAFRAGCRADRVSRYWQCATACFSSCSWASKLRKRQCPSRSTTAAASARSRRTPPAPDAAMPARATRLRSPAACPLSMPGTAMAAAFVCRLARSGPLLARVRRSHAAKPRSSPPASVSHRSGRTACCHVCMRLAPRT